MILCKKADVLSLYLNQQNKSGKQIGFVPTMGALHKGHLSLIEASARNNDITVCSIFVNPTQFNNVDDFKHYPVTIESDLQKLLGAGCDVVFLPTTQEIYPPDFQKKQYDLGELENILEGQFRPGHFQGVCQVVDRLLQIVQPTNLYLGAKDYQQCKVITRLTSLLEKEDEIAIHIEPTFREEDGLAMSSRNLRLSPTQRELAPKIFAALQFIKDHQNATDLSFIQDKAVRHLSNNGFRVDYLEIADADTLQPATHATGNKVALVAAYLGDIRLIDNLPLN